MLGKILAKTGAKPIPFVADIGNSVNILPARFAAAGGLRWRELDRDESTFVSVTNEELTIIGRPPPSSSLMWSSTRSKWIFSYVRTMVTRDY